MRRIEHALNAEIEIEVIAEYLREFSESAADKFLADLQHTIELVAAVPGIGHRRNDLPNPDHRCHFVGKYGVIYRYTDDVIYILHVVHGRRDFTKLFES
jgi:toxin ParE1/3/4